MITAWEYTPYPLDPTYYLPPYWYSSPTLGMVSYRGWTLVGMGREYRGYSRVTDAGHYYIHLPIHPLLQSYPY